MFISKTATAATLLLLALLLQGCGRKGPLYIQQEPAKPVPAAKTHPAPNQTMQNQPESNK